jgi:hypothetical protein
MRVEAVDMKPEPTVKTSPSSNQSKSKKQSHPTLRTRAPGSARQPDTVVDGLVYIATTFPNNWIVDSGSTNHICKDKSIFTTYKPATNSIGGIGKDRVQVVGIGDVKLVCNKGNKRGVKVIHLVNVVHCPSIKVNILSVSELVKRGAKVAIDKRACLIHYGARSVNAEKTAHGLYLLKTGPN